MFVTNFHQIPDVSQGGGGGFSWTVTPQINEYIGQSYASRNWQRSSNFTPPNNSLLVALISPTVSLSTTAAQRNGITLEGGGLTWTRRIRNDVFGTQVYAVSTIMWTAPITTGALMNCNVQLGFAVSSSDMSFQVFALSGPTTIGVGPAQQSNNNMYGTGTMKLTLNTAPASTSLVLGSRTYNDQSTSMPLADPGNGLTEIYDAATGSGGWANIQSMWRTQGSANNDVIWADYDTLNRGAAQVYAAHAMALEFTGT